MSAATLVPKVPKPQRAKAESTANRSVVASLPEGWRWVTLREIAEIKGGITKGQKLRQGQSTRPVPYLRVANVQRGYLDLSEVKTIEARQSDIDALNLRPGDILFNEGGDRDKLGRGWVWNEELPECIHQNHVFRARLRDTQNSPKFISFYSNSAGQKYFWDEGKHTTNLASINLTKLGSLPIPLPPPDQQRRIVAEIEKQFTRLDAGVASLKRVQAALKRYRASVLKAACEGRLVPTEAELARQEGRFYESATELLARIFEERRCKWNGRGKYKEPATPKASGFPVLPEGWVWASVEQLSAKVVDGVHKKPSYVDVGIPFVTVRNLTAGPDISFEKLNYVTIEDHREFSKRANPERGDILVSKDGTLGVVRLINTDQEFSIFVSVALVKPVNRAMSSYFGTALASPHVQAQMVPKGSGLQHIHLEDLREDCIPVPPLAEQNRIVAEVERHLTIIEGLNTMLTANLRRALRLRQSILQKAFSGQLK